MQGLDNPTVTGEAKYFIDFTDSKKKCFCSILQINVSNRFFVC